MKITYDPQAKAEALSRLAGALREEAALYETACPVALAKNDRIRLNTINAQIALRQEVEDCWQTHAEDFAAWRRLAQKIKANEAFDARGPEDIQERQEREYMEEVSALRRAKTGGPETPAQGTEVGQSVVSAKRLE